MKKITMLILIIIIPLGYIYFYEIKDVIKDIKEINNKENN